MQADPLRVAQIVANLLNNAAKYTEPKRPHPAAWPRSTRDDVVIEVSDNGIGIAPESLPAVFDMFTQLRGTDDRASGLGIGLALTKGLVELHGGSIGVRSEGGGRGSVFTVRLPRGEAPSARPRRPTASSRAQRRRAASWWPTTTATPPRAWPRCSQLEGHEVTLAYDGADALRRLRARASADLPARHRHAARTRQRGGRRDPRARGRPRAHAGGHHRLGPGRRPQPGARRRLRPPPDQAGRPRATAAADRRSARRAPSRAPDVSRAGARRVCNVSPCPRGHQATKSSDTSAASNGRHASSLRPASKDTPWTITTRASPTTSTPSDAAACCWHRRPGGHHAADRLGLRRWRRPSTDRAAPRARRLDSGSSGSSDPPARAPAPSAPRKPKGPYPGRRLQHDRRHGVERAGADRHRAQRHPHQLRHHERHRGRRARHAEADAGQREQQLRRAVRLRDLRVALQPRRRVLAVRRRPTRTTCAACSRPTPAASPRSPPIFPGCYSGRMPHIHIEVYRSETTATSYTNKLKTTQLAFPTDVCTTIYSTACRLRREREQLRADQLRDRQRVLRRHVHRDVDRHRQRGRRLRGGAAGGDLGSEPCRGRERAAAECAHGWMADRRLDARA